MAADPAGVAGFFYHPRLVGTVHLVTLGWISASIVGVVYMLRPRVLRGLMSRRATEFGAFWSYCLGTLGTVFRVVV